jgi:predicted Zn-dependent peptidase
VTPLSIGKEVESVKRTVVSIIATVICAACATTAPPPRTVPGSAPRTGAATSVAFSVPVEYHTLPNGLRVVLSPVHMAPRVTVAVYYATGFRVEPKGRAGFAHLFEHLMFQGSRNLGKMEIVKLVQSNGGVLNGRTRFDFTTYYEIVPSNMLRTVLWAEADRMKGLNFTEENLANQKAVVSNEARVQVLNRPYGGFPWLDVPQVANVNWHNAHDFSADLADIDAATLEDARSFFKTYYAPNNASIAIAGDFDPAGAMSWVRDYFGGIPSQPQPPAADVSEPRQEQEKHGSKTDERITRPALAIAYHAPEPETDAYYAMAIINQILAAGKDSWLYEDIVRKRGLTGGIEATLNPNGSMFDLKGPALYTIDLYHDADKSSDEIVKAIEESIDRLRMQPVDAATLERARVKMRAAFYDDIESDYGYGRADLLAAFALFYDDPERINRIESRFAAVTPELIRKTAEEYLRPTNRTIFTVVPKTPGGK